MRDRYDEQLSSARYKAERDQARQELARLRGEATTMSAYDLLPDEDREALRWVRKKGGLDAVRQRWERLSCYADTVPRSCMEKRLARLQRQVDESHAALRRRNQRIALLESEINRAHNENRMEFLRRAGNYTAFADEACKRLAPQLRYVEGCTKDVMDAALEALDSRLMPEGMEWPRYENGDPVKFGDELPEFAETIYKTVKTVTIQSNGYVTIDNEGGSANRTVIVKPGERVKRPAVLAADKEPLEVGKTAWHVDGRELTVIGLPKPGEYQGVKVQTGNGFVTTFDPSLLTHTKPEIDSWERIEEDLSKTYIEYWGCGGIMCEHCPSEIDGKKPHERLDGGSHNCISAMRRDIVRRCRALAERGE